MTMPVESPIIRLFPEVYGGGFSRVDGTIEFYVRVNALLSEIGPDAVVLDYGAGRGAGEEDPVRFRRDLRRLQDKAGRVVGVDIDDAVLENPSLDEAHVIRLGQQLPLDDTSIDLVVSDYTFEHVTDPAWVASELDRVLRPGGWLCARTPNRWGYIGLGARAVPNRLHSKFLRRLQPKRRSDDSFPTAYHLNTPRALRRWFPPQRFHQVVYAADSEPTYVGRSMRAARLSRVAFALTPPRFRSVLYVFLEKR
jgi:SAM-dependent methyltransferase